MATYEYSLYQTDKDNFSYVLNKYGVAIIPYVLDYTECENMLNGMWDFLEHASNMWDVPIERNKSSTWKEIYNLCPKHSMLIQHWGVGHIQASWDVRQNPKIVEIFSTMWGVPPQELLVSFDGLSFGMPPETTNRGWNRGKTWFHSDQSFTRNDFECVQSWVTALDVNEGDATLSILEGSHHLHEEFATEFGVKVKSDWYKLNTDEQKFFISRGCEMKNIRCPAGSLVLWDSRTIHCGVEATRGRYEPNFRAVIYLCYMPREGCSEKLLEKKRKAFETLRTTTHWADRVKMFPKKPRPVNGNLLTCGVIPKPILTDLGKKLAGY
jgi:hypothetical protein